MDVYVLEQDEDEEEEEEERGWGRRGGSFALRDILMSVRTHFEDKKDQIASLCQAGDWSSGGGSSGRSWRLIVSRPDTWRFDPLKTLNSISCTPPPSSAVAASSINKPATQCLIFFLPQFVLSSLPDSITVFVRDHSQFTLFHPS